MLQCRCGAQRHDLADDPDHGSIFPTPMTVYVPEGERECRMVDIHSCYFHNRERGAEGLETVGCKGTR